MNDPRLEALPPIMTPAQVSELLMCSRSKIYEEIALFTATDGKAGLPHLRIGRQIRIASAVLLARLGFAASNGHVDAATAREGEAQGPSP